VARRRKRAVAVVRYRLTPVGWLVLAIGVLVCLAAINTKAALLFALFGCLIAAVQASAIIARRMIASVELSREMPSRAWQHQTVYVGYTLRNTRNRGACLGLTVEEIAPEGIECAPGYCVHLPAGAVFRSGGRFSAHKRGRIRLQRIKLSTLFPLGLIGVYTNLDQSSELVVWPARGGLRNNILQHGAVHTSRSAPSQASGGEDEFFGLRDYRSEDCPRWIHWRRSAAKANLVVRELAHPLPETLWIIIDTFEDDSTVVSDAQMDRLLRFAATLVDTAVSRSFLVGMALALPTGVSIHAPSNQRDQRRKLLDTLADIGGNIRYRLELTLRELDCHALEDSQVVVISANSSVMAPAGAGRFSQSCRSIVFVHPGNCDQFFYDVVDNRPEEDSCL